MAKDFDATEPIILQPASRRNAQRFIFSTASDLNAKGNLPYGSEISSITVSGSFAETGADVTSELIDGVPTVSSNIVTVLLNYPITTGEGKYHLKFILTLSDTSVYERDYTNINAENI